MRGTRLLTHRHALVRRFIPASAGNASSTAPIRRRSTVHPRECGERVTIPKVERLRGGSSPRVRGTLYRHQQRRNNGRFIPASAGNARVGPSATSYLSVHPRECGERGMKCPSRSRPCGSSPRVRGTRYRTGTIPSADRFIPASAGNACLVFFQRPLSSVHPRECGERIDNWHVLRLPAGSSPRVRGTHVPDLGVNRVGRFIPASAGNAYFLVKLSSTPSVHPRECGERAKAAEQARVKAGSSPRVRGTP